MKSSPLDSQIRSRIDAFVSEISNLVRTSALDAVRGAFGETGTAAPAARLRLRSIRRITKAAAPAPARARRGKRTSAEVAELGGTLLQHIQQNPGQRLEEIGKALAMPTKGMKLPIAKLLAEGAIRTEGQKRGTKYFAGGKGRGRRARKA